MPDHTHLKSRHHFRALNDMYLHAKRQLHTSNSLWDIKVQSSSSFLHWTREPDFSQTYCFNKIIKVIMVHDSNTKNLHVNGLFFLCKIRKTLIFWYFWTLSPKQYFFPKICPRQFPPLRHPNFTRSFRKILRAILEKTRLTADLLIRDCAEIIGPLFA